MCQLALVVSTQTAGKHFIQTFVQYLESVVDEAKDRVNDGVDLNTVEEYLSKRRLSGGGGPSFVALELHLDLPDEAFYHPAIREMQLLGADMIMVDNVSLSKIK